VSFRSRHDWEWLVALARARKLPFFTESFQRFERLAEEHRTFVLRDPSNDLLEFKRYDDPGSVLSPFHLALASVDERRPPDAGWLGAGSLDV
jgi:hypothetical protein